MAAADNSTCRVSEYQSYGAAQNCLPVREAEEKTPYTVEEKTTTPLGYGQPETVYVLVPFSKCKTNVKFGDWSTTRAYAILMGQECALALFYATGVPHSAQQISDPKHPKRTVVQVVEQIQTK